MSGGVIYLFPNPSGAGGDWIAAASGLAGALLGATITEYFNRRLRQNESRAKRKASAHSTLHLLNRVFSDALGFRDHVRSARLNMEREEAAWVSAGLHYEDGIEVRRLFSLPMYVEPYAHLSADAHFAHEDLWTLHSFGDPDLPRSVELLDRRLNAIVEALLRYGRERDELSALFARAATSVDVRGQVAAHSGGPDSLQPLQVPLTRLTSLLLLLEKMSDELARDALSAMRLLIQAPARPLGPEVKMTAPDPDGGELTILAEDGWRPPSWWVFWRPKESPKVLAERLEARSANSAARND